MKAALSKTSTKPISGLGFSNPVNLFTMLFIVLTMAQTAFAQCGGKTVYLQLPEEWGDDIYIFWEGQFKAITGTSKQGDWTVFNLPTGLPNDMANKKDLIFVNHNDYFNNYNPIYAITTSGYSSSQNIPSSTTAFQCSQFGDNGTWIMEDLANPGKTLVSNEPPYAKSLYFLPPNTQDWIGGIPYIMDRTMNAKAMEAMPGKCGWYRMVYFNEEPPSSAIIGIGPSVREGLGLPKGIDIAEKFASLGNNEIYFVAESGLWHPVDPGIDEPHRCSYTMAAIIYDTDASVHPDFSCGEWGQLVSQGNGTNTYANCQSPGFTGAYTSGGNLKPLCYGVQKNIVQPTLDPVTKKVKYNAEGDVNGCWTSESWFDTAFKSSPGVNVQLCYDMPFGKQNNGLWEFDSDKLQNANGNLVGGFFPDILNVGELNTAYTSCPNCNAKRNAEVFTPLVSAVPKDAFDSYQSKQGDFASGDSRPFIIDIMGSGSLTSTPWDWPARDNLNWYLHGNTAIRGGSKGQANQHFCFESHASFKYDPAQEFYFVGDDAIWVYIDNRLVVDLGGTHLAAPGHVKLKDMVPPLKVDEEYPIDIFFCDMRTTQSNVRIKSNIYFAQKAADGGAAGLFVQEAANGGKTLCLREAANNCAALMGGSAPEICGAELAPRISYELVFLTSGFGKFSLDESNEFCEWSNPTNGVCYGGIVLGNGTVTVNEADIPDGVKTLGYELYAAVDGYSPLNLSRAEAVPPTAVMPRAPQMLSQEPRYYTLRGEPLGGKKPSKAGVYIMRQGSVSRMVAVR